MGESKRKRPCKRLSASISAALTLPRRSSRRTARSTGSTSRTSKTYVSRRSSLRSTRKWVVALRDAGNVVGIGIGSPGNIDASSGAVLYSPNFGWQNAPLGEALRKKFSVPVFVANDARCATLGEYTFGMGRKTKDFVLLTLGTGIGGGIVG